MSSVYIHIPFCKNICSYCDFPKFLYQEEFVFKYLEILNQEIENSYNGEEVKTIYIGGGTPSVLSIKELKLLFTSIEKLNKNHLQEFTFECNVDDLNQDLLQFLKTNGVNRLSIGIQSFNEDKLNFMNRKHSFQETKDKIELCKELGFTNLNVDLMYGIPNETLSVLKKDLRQFLKLDVPHISTYSLIIEDNTKLGNNEIKNIDEELDYKMYNLINNTLSKKYQRYEVSNFAKDSNESKHNLIYWHNQEYYGFGLGASGYYAGVRYENTRNLTKYLQGDIKSNEEILSKKDTMDNEIMLGLRTTKGINVIEFFNKYEENIQDIYPVKELIKENYLIYKDNNLYINPKHIYIMNEILLKIL